MSDVPVPVSQALTLADELAYWQWVTKHGPDFATLATSCLGVVQATTAADRLKAMQTVLGLLSSMLADFPVGGAAPVISQTEFAQARAVMAPLDAHALGFDPHKLGDGTILKALQGLLAQAGGISGILKDVMTIIGFFGALKGAPVTTPPVAPTP